MEAAPRLPMISFELKVTTEPVSFGPKLKQYIGAFYHEDPESYNTEIQSLEQLRAAAVRPTVDVTSCQTLKRYYCQLNFLKSRFPMKKGQACAISFTWKDVYVGVPCSMCDIDFELMSVLYNIGALHTQLGAAAPRSTSEGMKMSCTHFQCAAWAFNHLNETYPQLISLSMAPEVVHLRQQLCLAQAQECILEKSMMDNRKSTIIAKVAAQVLEYYGQAAGTLAVGGEDGPVGEVVGGRVYKEWTKYLRFKVTYHGCVARLYQGQQAEEQQKMGERVAHYQAASQLLEEARRQCKGFMPDHQHEIEEALAFTQDVVEGKRKAAKNENEFIYHEAVPDLDTLPHVTGASLVKGIPFSVDDPDVSGADIFSRLVPMEAHEVSSVYSEQKAEMLRQIGAIVENKDQELSELMSSLQLDCVLSYRRQQSAAAAADAALPQEIVDRAAALSARPDAVQTLVDAMGRLAGAYHDVEALLEEIRGLLSEESERERSYQAAVGTRAPSIVATDLSREANKYMEAHAKANESNQTLHKAMVVHVANLKLLSRPLVDLQHHIPTVRLEDATAAEADACIAQLETLLAKVEEMKSQRAQLVAQLRDAVCGDDITGLLVTRPPTLTLDQLFRRELDKHKKQASLVEQNLAAQDNILRALTECYARVAPVRRHLAEAVKKREAAVNALLVSYDAYDDLLTKANKGIEFYHKLETNVSKLLQRLRSTCNVQQEERDHIMEKNRPTTPAVAPPSSQSSAPKLKDYLAGMKLAAAASADSMSGYVLPAVRPTPLGSEETSDKQQQQQQQPCEYPGYVQQYAQQPTYPYYEQWPMATPAPEQNSRQTYCQTPGSQQYQMDGGGIGTGSAAGPYQNAYVANPSGYYQSEAGSATVYQPNNVGGYQAGPASLYQSGGVGSGAGAVAPANMNYQTTNTSNNSVAYHSGVDCQTIGSGGGIYRVSPATATTYQTGTSQQPSGTYYPMEQMPAANAAAYPTGGDTGALPTYYPATGYEAAVNQPTDPANYQQQYGMQQQQYPSGQTYMQQPQYEGQYAAGQNSLQIQQQEQQYQNNYYYNLPYGYQTCNQYPTTYMNSSNSDSTATASGSAVFAVSSNSGAVGGEAAATAVAAEPSNVDLLAGLLDFAAGPAPLLPESSAAVDRRRPAATVKADGELTTAGPAAVQTPKSVPPVPSVVDPVHLNETVSPTAGASLSSLPCPTPPAEATAFAPACVVPSFKQFVSDVEKLEKFVEGLTVKTLNGPTPLDLKWKEIQERQEKDAQKFSISVARCYPIKNRLADFLPYDQTRVELPSTKDDYINASHVRGLSERTPDLIVTQAPLSTTLLDFWTMVWEQQTEVVVCLLTDGELLAAGGGAAYWPAERGQELDCSGRFRVTLQSVDAKARHWTERILTLTQLETRASRVLVHLQQTDWSGSMFPASPAAFLGLVGAALAYRRQQRPASRAVLCHCLGGAGRSGLFCLVAAALCEMSADPPQLPDLAAVLAALNACRKNALRDREHLRFAYQAVLYHAQQLLLQQGILSSRSGNFQDARPRHSHSRHPSQDLLVDQLLASQFQHAATLGSDAPHPSGVPKADPSNAALPVDPLSQLDPLWTARKD